MSKSPTFSKPRRGRSIWVVFAACILIGMLFGILGGAGVVDKVVAGTVFCAAWLLGINVWHLGVIIEGKVYWRGGPLLASRELNPTKFWRFVCVSVIAFNAVGLWILYHQVTMR